MKIIVAVVFSISIVLIFWSRKQDSSLQSKVKAPISEQEQDQPVFLKSQPLNLENQQTYQQIVDLHKRKRLGEAITLAKETLKTSNDPNLRSWIERQLPKLLMSQAWLHYRESNCADAIPLFEESLLYSNEALSLKGMAACYYKDKDFWSSSVFIEQYLAIQTDFDGLIIYLESLESLGQFEDAWLKLKEILANNSFTDEQLKILNQRLQTIEEKKIEFEQQTDIQGQYAILHYRPNDDYDIGMWAMDIADEAIGDFVNYFELSPPTRQIEIFFYSVKGFQKINHGPAWARGLYDGRIRIPIPESFSIHNKQVLSKTLRHEIAHAVLSENLKGLKIPTWFQEGFAQLVECQPKCEDFRFPAKRGSFLSIETFKNRFTGMNPQEARIAYIQSLFMMKTLIRKSGSDSIARIIEAFRENPNLEELPLAAAKITFENLYEESARSWENSEP